MNTPPPTPLTNSLIQPAEGSPAHESGVEQLLDMRAKLLIREAQLSQAQRMAGMASWEWYFGDTKIRWSPEMYVFWGYEPNEIEVDLATVAQSTHPGDLPVLEAAVAKALQGDDLEMEYRRYDKFGREIYIHTIGRIVHDEAGKAIGVFGVDMNITRQKEQERQLRELNETLARQNQQLEQRNAELSSFTHVASHDLQEPLRKIKSFNQMILDQEAERLSERGREFFKRSIGAAARMQELIHDLLNYARINGAEHVSETFSLADLVTEVQTDLQEAITKSQAVIRLSELPEITAVRFMFGQLLQNLLSNALKFHRPGQPPVVTISHQYLPASNEHELTISDEGIGFSPQYRERIFQLFQRLHSQSEYPGTGIGLAICQRVMHNHGGSIEAHSQPGEGATFVMRWPLANA
ncbi:PAS/PAC sensor signal transduction histidine kinase [Fibrella aestuarina BUZ 2]|uniref:histidine kinase n=1 Tax=Fibrella aestuarina BUZ 2 TaxID=1166018 RepID=I0K4B6_9BACT|nr:PAS domain-containing sensor histidine kinase [Fibrella aestuarina]CCG98969.1 PAS/PAC sensor signal transduction histidine kinase [Fibrella aestuarina BUZ 2]